MTTTNKKIAKKKFCKAEKKLSAMLNFFDVY